MLQYTIEIYKQDNVIRQEFYYGRYENAIIRARELKWELNADYFLII